MRAVSRGAPRWPMVLRITGILTLLIVIAWFVARSPQDEAPAAAQNASRRDEKAAEPSNTPSAETEAQPAATERNLLPEFRLEILVRKGASPVPDAVVKALPWSAQRSSQAASRRGIPASALHSESRESRTDADGHLFLEKAQPPLFIAARGTATGSRGVIWDGSSNELVIDLPPGHRIHGVVRDETGHAIPDASVRCRRSTYVEGGYSHKPTLPERIAGMMFESSARTDGDGRFELGGLDPGTAVIEFAASGFASKTYSDATIPFDDEIEIVLDRHASPIAGIVIDKITRNPVESAWVVAYRAEDLFNLAEEAATFTDEHGAFELGAVSCSRERMALRVSCDGYASRRLPVPTGPEGIPRRIDIELAAGQEIHGTARSEAGAPIDDVVVAVCDTATKEWIDEVRTDATGAYSVDSVSATIATTVRAGANGWATEERLVPPKNQGTVDFVLRRTASVRGRVESDGSPLGPGKARLMWEDNGGTRADYMKFVREIDPVSGVFEFTEVPAAKYVLDVHVDGFAIERVWPVEAKALAPDEFTVVVPIRRGRVIAGRVTAADTHEPVVGAVVAVADRIRNGEIAGAIGVRCTTNAEGRFSIPDAPQIERVAVFVDRCPPYARATTEWEVAPGVTETAHDIELVRGGSVRVRANDQAGRALTRLGINMADSANVCIMQESTSGEILVEGVQPGPIRLAIDASDDDHPEFAGSWTNREAIVESGRVTDIQLILGGGARVHGTIKGAHLAAGRRDQMVRATPIDGAGGGSITARVDPGSNTFLFPSVPPGRKLFRFATRDQGDFVSAEQVLDVIENGDHVLDFDLAGNGFEGFVRDNNGKAIPGVKLSFRSDAPGEGAMAHSASTDGAGAYRVRGLKPVEYHYVAKCDGYGQLEGRLFAPQDDSVAPHDFTLTPESTLIIGVTDRAGAAITAAQIRASPQGGMAEWALAPTGPVESGRYRIHGASGGAWEISIAAAGFFAERRTVACVAGQATPIDVAMRRLGNLQLTVRGPSGIVHSGQALRLIDLDSGADASEWVGDARVGATPATLVPDDDGMVHFTNLPEGKYRAEFGASNIEFEVVAGTTTEKALTLLGG